MKGKGDDDHKHGRGSNQQQKTHRRKRNNDSKGGGFGGFGGFGGVPIPPLNNLFLSVVKGAATTAAAKMTSSLGRDDGDRAPSGEVGFVGFLSFETTPHGIGSHKEIRCVEINLTRHTAPRSRRGRLV